MERKTPALFYDHECPLCLRFKMTLERSQSFDQLHYFDINDPRTLELFPELNHEQVFDSLHLIDEENKIHQAEAAVAWLVERHSKVKDWLWLLNNQMGQKAIEYFYDQTNKLRKRLKNNCPGCNNRRHDYSL